MTKTDWTAEEVRARFTTWAASRGMDLDRIPPDTYRNIETHASWIGYKAAFADRIEADEREVPVAWFRNIVYIGETTPFGGIVGRTGIDCEIIPGKDKPAQTSLPRYAARNVNSDWRPLYLHPPAQPAQEQPGWKVPEALLTWANAEDGGDSMYDAARRHVREMLTIKPEPSPVPPKEK